MNVGKTDEHITGSQEVASSILASSTNIFSCDNNHLQKSCEWFFICRKHYCYYIAILGIPSSSITNQMNIAGVDCGIIQGYNDRLNDVGFILSFIPF